MSRGLCDYPKKLIENSKLGVFICIAPKWQILSLKDLLAMLLFDLDIFFIISKRFSIVFLRFSPVSNPEV